MTKIHGREIAFNAMTKSHGRDKSRTRDRISIPLLLDEALDEAIKQFREPTDDDGDNADVASWALVTQKNAMKRRQGRADVEVAYDLTKDTQDIVQSPSLRRLTALHRWAAENDARALVVLIIVTLLATWFLTLYFPLTGDQFETYEWQLEAWERKGKTLDNILFCWSMLAIASILVAGTAILLRSESAQSSTALAGSLVRELFKHYQASTKQQAIKQSINSIAFCNFVLAVVMGACLLVIAWAFHALSNDALGSWRGVLHLCGLSIVLVVLALSVFALNNYVAMHCELMRRMIVAYKELIDVACFLVLREWRKHDLKAGCKTEEDTKKLYFTVREHPDVEDILNEMHARECHLLVAAHELMHVVTVPSASSVYSLVAIYCACMLLRSYMACLRLLSSDWHAEIVSEAVLYVAITLVSIIPISWPLFAMATQAAAWSNLENALSTNSGHSLNTDNRQLVYTIIEDDLYERHTRLRSFITWKILGIEVSPRTVYSSIAAYGGTTLLPAVATAVIDFAVDRFKGAMA